MYETTEELKRINGNHSPYGYGVITLVDLSIINSLITRIQVERATEIPTPLLGDRVRLINQEDGTIHEDRAVFDEWWDVGKMSICVHASTHLLSDLHVSTSGGPQFSAFPDELTYLGEVQGQFWAWGHYGAVGGGGITFYAPVHHWEITAPHSRFL